MTGAEYEGTLAYPDAAGPLDRVSVLALVGGALLDLSPGQVMCWQVPGGRESGLRILDATFQPSALGEYHR